MVRQLRLTAWAILLGVFDRSEASKVCLVAMPVLMTALALQDVHMRHRRLPHRQTVHAEIA